MAFNNQAPIFQHLAQHTRILNLTYHAPGDNGRDTYTARIQTANPIGHITTWEPELQLITLDPDINAMKPATLLYIAQDAIADLNDHNYTTPQVDILNHVFGNEIPYQQLEEELTTILGDYGILELKQEIINACQEA